MKYEVWFVRVGEAGPDGATIRFPGGASDAPPFDPAYYAKVAEVEAGDLEEVFYLTNSIDHPWWENPGVTLAPGLPGARSMSVGDVAVGGGWTAGGEPRAWVVDRVGWTPTA